MHRNRLATLLAPLAVIVLVQCRATPQAPPPAPGRVVPVPHDFTAVPIPIPETGEALPRPYRQRLDLALGLNRTCTGCHVEETSEWERSLHHHAYDNGAFQAALAVEPMPFCRGCHAPEADPRKVEPALATLGVGCVSCHVAEDGVVLAAAGAPSSAAPHGVRRSKAFAETGGCAGCHEFPFPGGSGGNDAELMQTTVREHARTSSAGVACATCHMPRLGARRSHTFAEVRDPAWLRERLVVKAEPSADKLRITLEQTAPGHAFPTGDLFRRLEVGMEQRDSAGRIVRREAAHLTRHFETLPGHSARQLTLDDRVFEGPRIVELPLRRADANAPSRVSWWVTYQRIAGVGTGNDSSRATLESEVSLHSGVLPWETK